MKTERLRKSFSRLVGMALFAAFAVGCANMNDPYYPSGGYGSGPYYGGSPYGYGGGYRDDYYYNQRERERLQDERERVERERLRLEREREQQYQRPYQPPYQQPPSRPAPSQDRCPSGFSPSEQKCSQSERSRGCQDIRLPSGLGCVKR
jgi:hypothetical protein